MGSDGGYPIEEEEDGKKTRVDQTPLWKYVTRLGGGKGSGTTKFVFPIVTLLTQVHIPMPERIYVGKWG